MAKVRIKTTDRITIAGTPGSGKTTAAKTLLRAMPSVFVFDAIDQYPEYPRFVPQTHTKEEFDAVCHEVWNRGNVMFLIEEAELYLPNIALTGFPLWAKKVILQGRNRGIGIMAITHSLADLSKTYFKSCQHAFVYYLFAPNDISYLKDFLRDKALEVPSLPPFHCYHYSNGQTLLLPPFTRD